MSASKWISEKRYSFLDGFGLVTASSAFADGYVIVGLVAITLCVFLSAALQEPEQ